MPLPSFITVELHPEVAFVPGQKWESAWKLNDEYTIGARFGKDYVGCTNNYIARKNGVYYVVKSITLRNPAHDTITPYYDFAHNQFLNEYSLLKRLDDEPGVVKQHGIIRTTHVQESRDVQGTEIFTTVDQMHVVLDCYKDHYFKRKHPSRLTDLANYVKRQRGLIEHEAMSLFLKILKIVKRLHMRNVYHRDLQPSNMILNERTREITFVNFGNGVSTRTAEEKINLRYGSFAYFAPEIVSGLKYSPGKADMWALGISYYILLHNHYPISCVSRQHLFEQLTSGNIDIPIFATLRAESREIIFGCLKRDAGERMTIDNAIEVAERYFSRNMGIGPNVRLEIFSTGAVQSAPVRENTQANSDTGPATLLFSKLLQPMENNKSDPSRPENSIVVVDNVMDLMGYLEEDLPNNID